MRVGVRAIPDRMSTVNKAHSGQGWGVCQELQAFYRIGVVRIKTAILGS